MPALGDSLLLASGLAPRDRLDEARVLARRDGLSLGEALVRLRAVAEDDLVAFFERRLLVPRVARERLQAVPADVLATVPADLAAECRVFPVEVDADGAVMLAMADPADTHAADEVAFYADRTCHRVVAPESAIRDAIERHYGIRFRSARRPERTTLSLAAVIPDEHLTATSTAAPPGPPPAPTTPRRAASAGASSASTRAVPPPLEPPILPIDDDEPVLVLTRRPTLEMAAAAGPIEPTATDSATASRPRTITRSHAVVPPPDDDHAPLPPPIAAPARRGGTLPGVPIAQLVPDPPLEALRTASSREAVDAALLDYAALAALRAALLVVRKGALHGFDARGAVPVDELRRLVLPLDEPSLLREAIESRRPYRGPALGDAPHAAFAARLGAPSGDALALPLSIGDRVVAVLYADGLAAPIPEETLAQLATEASAAYARLVRSARR